MEKRTFLGLATGPMDPSLRAQLGIPRGTGITIHHVDKDSPSGKVLQEHDVLTKFNDQILVSHDQLAVLVENSKPGDNVSLTIFRGGKEQTVTVTLSSFRAPVPFDHMNDVHGGAVHTASFASAVFDPSKVTREELADLVLRTLGLAELRKGG
jgi:C-terminal processing protease CtpA/Prc